jgi:hypothetical protein
LWGKFQTAEFGILMLAGTVLAGACQNYVVGKYYTNDPNF